MPQITGFTEEIRLGKWPFCLDVGPLEGNDYNGVGASFYVCPALAIDRIERAELRRKENFYRLFIFRHSDAELPEWWADSELVWQLPAKEEGDAGT